jgi:transcriptional regulator with XRE-family HTH domain
MKKAKMETGKLIRELRIKKGLTQEELAEKTEVSARTIQRIENGEVDPRAYTLQMIAKALEVDYTIFVCNETGDEAESERDKNSSTLVVLHLSAIVPLVFHTILIRNRQKVIKMAISEQFREIISLQLKVWVTIIAASWIYWKTGILLPLIGVFIANAIFCIVNAIRVLSGNYVPAFPSPKNPDTSWKDKN